MPNEKDKDSTENNKSESLDFEALDNDPNLTQETLQAKLQDYQRAIREEFAESVKEDESLQNVEEYTREFFKKNVSIFAGQIAHLAVHAESETVRLSASKYGVELAIADAAKDGDPVKELLKKLSKGKTKVPVKSDKN